MNQSVAHEIAQTGGILELELGKPFSEASVKVGFTSGSPNHNRLLRNEKIMARIEGWRTKTFG